ncbi:MAG: phenylacetate--CoA ligase family protein [Zoogloeaceae bacterium]|nr:phenylacetate--CoA ligase family protein [Zoogloeaceae bacterium]
MSLYTQICSNILFPLHERLKGHHSVALRKQLEQSQHWPRERLDAYRVERLRAFLTQIGQTVPYYRELFARSGFRPEQITSLDVLTQLPLLTKADIRAATDTLKAENHGPLSRYNTGGSSGEPLIFYMGKGRKSHDVAAKWRATRWWGVDIGDPELVVWGSPVELGAQDRIRQLRDRLMRSELLPAFEMSPANLDRFVQTIRDCRPAMLFGYPSSLSLIARHAQQNGIAMDKLGIKVAFVTSERLYDEQRKLISDVFGCPVANGYGARDAGFIAHECPHGSLHISAEDIIVETVDADGQPTPEGVAGEIVVTHTGTVDFPFVRYRTGDVGVLSNKPCACGLTLPVLSEIQGRTTDFVVAHDGTIMHGLALIYTVRDLPGVEKFKIVQESIDRTEVLIVTNAHFDRAAEQRIVHDFKARLGSEVEVIIRQVDDIPPEKTGKYRYVTSKLVVAGPVAAD